MLVGRETECERIDEVLERARLGQSHALVVRGEPGIGKTALLDYAVERADGFSVVRALGVESEAELDFSGLLEVCRPLLDRLDRLPEQQAAALRGALGVIELAQRDRFAVGAATLSLLAAAAEKQPLLVVVDDVQWLDNASADALRFAGRRLLADPVALLVAARAGEGSGFETAGFDELTLRGLDREATVRLLGETEVAPEVAALLHAETSGNPLALVELPGLLTADQLAGREAIQDPLPAGASVERAYAGRLERLPQDSRTALLVLALASEDRPEAIVRALAELGLSQSALDPPEDDGLIVVKHGRLAFRHPLLRSALLQAAVPSERRAVHRALGTVLTGRGDEERRAWHLAAAAVGPDEDAANALAASAARARDRSGLSAAAAAFERAARLTPDKAIRAERLADAADSAFGAGDAARAASLVAEVLADSDARLRARLLMLRGRVELQSGTEDAARASLLEAASLVEESDPAGAATFLTYVVFTCHFDGKIRESVGFSRRARALAPSDGGRADLQATYALGRSLLLAGEVDEGVPLLERFVEVALAGEPVPREQLGRAATCLSVLERTVDARPLAARAMRLAQEEGPMARLYALSLSTALDVRDGHWQRAAAHASEGVTLARDLGQSNMAADLVGELARIAAARGDGAGWRVYADQAFEHFRSAGMQIPLEQLRASHGLLQLGRDRLDEAVTTLEEGARHAAEMGLFDRDIAPEPDLVEALVRAGRRDEARSWLDAWCERGVRPGLAWGAALAARCDGLLADDDEFEASFARALALHDATEDPFALARTRLCLGERLRRVRRRVDARTELRAALETFERLGAAPWAERARRELRASGETLRRRDPTDEEQLTPQELQIALQVAEGRSNKEVAAALFLSPRTVEFHLRRTYRKAGVSSRAELIRRFVAEPTAAVP